MQTETTAVVTAAGTVLERKEKFETAIRDGVADLSNLIISRLEAERAFRQLEAAAAIGEPALGLEKARKVATDAQAALDQASLKLGGLRVALGAMGTSLAASHAALKLQIPIHENELIEQFNKEWAAACLLFSHTVGRRRGLETLLGRQLQLPEPDATPADLSELGQPHLKLDELERGLARIGHMREAAGGRRNLMIYPGMPHAPYDATQVYRVNAARGLDGIADGELVVDASCDAGVLDVAVAVGDAYLYREADAGELIAEKTTKAITAARTAADVARSEARLYANDDESKKNSARIPDQNYRPPATDPQKIADNIEAAKEERKVQRAGFVAEQEYAEQARLRAEKKAAELAKTRQEPAKDPAKKGEWPEGALL